MDCFCAACSFPRPGQSCALPYHLKKHYTIEHLTSRSQENRLSLSLNHYHYTIYRTISLDITIYHYISLYITIYHYPVTIQLKITMNTSFDEVEQASLWPKSDTQLPGQVTKPIKRGKVLTHGGFNGKIMGKSWENMGKSWENHGKFIENPSFMEDFPMNTEHLHF